MKTIYLPTATTLAAALGASLALAAYQPAQQDATHTAHGPFVGKRKLRPRGVELIARRIRRRRERLGGIYRNAQYQSRKHPCGKTRCTHVAISRSASAQ